ncbi:MAG: hypothetical protein ACLGIN_04965 [Candidatus Sericytochromatia bacterium]
MAGERSPNYPIISLAEGVNRVSAIYERERTHAADKDVIAKDLGFGSLNGASRGIISALRKYGLLIEEDDQLKVSTDALDILLHSPGRPERLNALTKAAFSPPLFAELRGIFGMSLPSDENLRAHLIKRGFNPNTVTNVIASYRDTVSMVTHEAGREAGPREAEAAPESAPTARPGAITMFAPAPAAEETTLAFKLNPQCHVHLAFHGEVTQGALRKLKDFLDLSMDAFAEEAELPPMPAIESSSVGP